MSQPACNHHLPVRTARQQLWQLELSAHSWQQKQQKSIQTLAVLRMPLLLLMMMLMAPFRHLPELVALHCCLMKQLMHHLQLLRMHLACQMPMQLKEML
jgi:hypothetical protein